ncbi:MAG: hypothetical protein ABIP93_18025 [Gemmatimonadaceae bacterium]
MYPDAWQGLTKSDLPPLSAVAAEAWVDPAQHAYREALTSCCCVIRETFGLTVLITDVPAPFTGDLDGAAITLDYELPPAEMLFTLLHLFGHTVQWTLSPADREIGLADPRGRDEAFLAEVARYERGAGEYALSLLAVAGITGLDVWLGEMTAADIAYLLHFYRTGEKMRHAASVVDFEPLLPRAIPSFLPQRWVARNAGVVI